MDPKLSMKQITDDATWQAEACVTRKLVMAIFEMGTMIHNVH
jgi:hypothetical protein